MTDVSLDSLRARFVIELGLDPGSDLMAPWVPLQLDPYSDCLPGPPAYWYEANLARAYFGPGYERGDLPLFVRCAEWLDGVLGGTVWYGDDCSDEIHPFGPQARALLLAYYERVGHEPYDSKCHRS